jgi:DNA polymerase-3 subunit alpha
MPKFVHLRLHTEYSIIDGMVTIPELINNCKEQHVPAVAITDRSNFFGLIKFYKDAISAGIKPIVGADILIHNDKDSTKPFTVTLLCQNKIGYKNVTKLISRAYVEGQVLGNPIVQRDWLLEDSEGLIVLSGVKGDVGHALLVNDLETAENRAKIWQRYFPNRYYLELQRTERNLEDKYNQAALAFAAHNSLPVVATNDIQFLAKDDFEAHEARVCIHAGVLLDDEKRPRNYSEQQYFKTADEMCELFADVPEALTNSVEIAKRCNVELTLGEIFLPKFPVPADISLDDYFAIQSQAGMQQRTIPAGKEEVYRERLQTEINVIKQMGFAGYFLIVADFIKWAKEHDIPVGPGRGSGAGSLVAYALGITNLDPIAHELLFERFLNPERVSLPDFDVDFCMEGRDRVIEYVTAHYGKESVAQIITFGTMAAKAVIRDVGRVLGLPYSYVDKIAKLVPFEIGMTLEKAIEQEVRLQELYKNEEDIKTLFDLALKLEGLTRNVGKHAGGIVIAPSKLTDFTPLYCEEIGANIVTQFDMKDVETIGLVKFDFLGLRTLTIIDWAVKAINLKHKAHGLAEIDIDTLSLEDTKTYDLLKACLTTAVFQLESRGMRDLMRRLQPDCFDDIVALVALFRPGPLQSGMVDDYVERKHGRAPVVDLHPAIKPILAPTYGVILYQEQVMQIAQVLSGYSLGAADLLRRAMGKKKPEEMAKQRAVFLDGAAQNGVDKHVANHIFDLMEKFAGYGFNKSHSAGYALIAYRTAWLKAHFPAEFIAAALSADMDNTDKVAVLIDECRKLELSIIAPHVNHSSYKFVVNDNNEIIYGLGAIKGVGESAAENTVQCRIDRPFTSILDFVNRVDTHKVNKKGLEALTKAGALDNLGMDRAEIFANIPSLLQMMDKKNITKQKGQIDMFADSDAEESLYKKIKAKPWTASEKLTAERETLGIYLSGHPLDQYREEFDSLITHQVIEISGGSNKTTILAGLVTAVKVLRTKSDKKMAIVNLEDHTGRIDITVFSELYEANFEKLRKDNILVIEGEVNYDNFTDGFRVQAKKISDLAETRANYAKQVWLIFDELGALQQKPDLSKNLATILKGKSGKSQVCVKYKDGDGLAGELKLGDKWRVKLDDELIAKLQELADKIVISYKL